MTLRGSFQTPGDKSISHRLGLLALLASGRCRVSNFAPGRDCATTLALADALGAGVTWQGDTLYLKGAEGDLTASGDIDCGNSGTTMRLLMGVLAASPGRFRLDGDESLRRRPMERVAVPLRAMGAAVRCCQGCPPVELSGGALKGIDYHLPVASAQLKSAVLLAGLRAAGETVVHEPAPSRDHSERLLALTGADLEGINGAWRIRPSRLTLPEELWVPGDPSSAAFLLSAAAIVPGSDLTARQMLLNPTRTGFLTVLGRMGARLEVSPKGEVPEPWGQVRVRHSPKLRGCLVTADEVPSLLDEVPVLALVASQASGETVFKGVSELRVKETDRLAALKGQLGAMGARLTERGDDLLVQGPSRLRVVQHLDSFGDHRMAMTLRLACLLAGEEAPISGEESVDISFPGFAETLGEVLQ